MLNGGPKRPAFITLQRDKDSHLFIILVGRVGFEPTKTYVNRFTVCRV